jgi:hypothetical protein
LSRIHCREFIAAVQSALTRGAGASSKKPGEEMNKTVVIAVGAAITVVVAVLIYTVQGPSFAQPGPPGPCAGGNPHCIVVTVTGQAINGIPNHQVHENHSVDIDWVIETQGYTFPANGIAFVDKPGVPLPDPNEFSCSLFNSTTFRCKDKRHTPGTYGYTVTLSGSPAVQPLDPQVINN